MDEHALHHHLLGHDASDRDRGHPVVAAHLPVQSGAGHGPRPAVRHRALLPTQVRRHVHVDDGVPDRRPGDRHPAVLPDGAGRSDPGHGLRGLGDGGRRDHRSHAAYHQRRPHEQALDDGPQVRPSVPADSHPRGVPGRVHQAREAGGVPRRVGRQEHRGVCSPVPVRVDHCITTDVRSFERAHAKSSSHAPTLTHSLALRASLARSPESSEWSTTGTPFTRTRSSLRRSSSTSLARATANTTSTSATRY